MGSPLISRVCVSVCLAVAVPMAGIAQHDSLDGGPFAGYPVLGAPFSADATTTLTRRDGTRVTTATARYYRDSSGRVRSDQILACTDAKNPTGSPRMYINVDHDLSDRVIYRIDPLERTFHQTHRLLAETAFGGGNTFTIPGGRSEYRVFRPAEGGIEESLGTREIEGVKTIGRGFIQRASDRVTEVVHERWESPELKVVVYSSYSDPREGHFEYRLTNIRRIEPAADLFSVPADYDRVVNPQRILSVSHPGGPKTPATCVR